MGLVAGLGANLWILVAAVPLGLAGIGGPLAGVAQLGGVFGLLLLIALAPALLIFGILKRSQVLLLAAFPVAAVLPQLLLNAADSTRALPSAPFLLGALSLAGYLLAAASWLERPVEVAEREGAPQPTRRPIVQAPLPARWKRRFRLYRALAATALLIPGVLFVYAFSSPIQARFTESFAGRLEAAQALLAAGIGALSLGLFRAYLVAPLTAHLAHDRDLAAAAERARKQARRGRPRPIFYIVVALALMAMMAVVLQRAGQLGGRP